MLYQFVLEVKHVTVSLTKKRQKKGISAKVCPRLLSILPNICIL